MSEHDNSLEAAFRAIDEATLALNQARDALSLGMFAKAEGLLSDVGCNSAGYHVIGARVIASSLAMQLRHSQKRGEKTGAIRPIK